MSLPTPLRKPLKLFDGTRAEVLAMLNGETWLCLRRRAAILRRGFVRTVDVKREPAFRPIFRRA
jgi:hypothetical protein